MSTLSRRNFVVGTAAMLPIAKAAFGREPLSASNLGVQLYTVRNTITKNPETVLKAIQDIGFKEIEAVYATLDQIGPALKQTKLEPVSVHVDTAIFMEGGGKLDEAIAKVKQFGFQYIVVPYIPPAQRGGAEVFKKLAAVLNTSGEKAKAAGLKLCYHNHAFEFEKQSGGSGLEIMMKETHKDLVFLELDIFWVSVAGNDPVSLLKKYSGRIPLLHLKDKASGIATQYNEKVPKETFKEVGNGSLDMPAVLAAAKRENVHHYFVEQDQTAGDPLDSLRQSYKYLSGRFAS
ncbi:MAG TPA: sugar phosphate isomerase/epimerase [Bryobacteraceae bacterium]|nr:sugar phosphate isomerase/epimerase [Bryobacteraceae bacterium]